MSAEDQGEPNKLEMEESGQDGKAETDDNKLDNAQLQAKNVPDDSIDTVPQEEAKTAEQEETEAMDPPAEDDPDVNLNENANSAENEQKNADNRNEPDQNESEAAQEPDKQPEKRRGKVVAEVRHLHRKITLGFDRVMDRCLSNAGANRRERQCRESECERAS